MDKVTGQLSFQQISIEFKRSNDTNRYKHQRLASQYYWRAT
jgi:hypothetical protein